MSDESLPRRWGRFLPSKARVVQRALSAAFPTRSECHQAVAGKASAAEALRSSEDIEAFGGVDEAQAGTKRRPGKKSKAPSSRDVEHSGFVGAQADLEPSIGPDGEVYEHEVTIEGEPTPIEEKLEAGEELTPDPTAAAFFDVDNTLIQGSSLIVFAQGLFRKKFFTIKEILPVVWKQVKFKLTGSENAEDVSRGREQALEFIKGRPVQELVDLCEEIVDQRMADKMWPGTKQLADMHIAAGHQVWLVSATPVQLAQILAQRLGFTGAIGTVAEAKDGVFTGRLVGDILHGPGKRHAVAALASIEQLDLTRCTAYSDSINDLPMLSMVGTAVAVNPDSKLRKEAETRGWDVRDFRSIRKATREYGIPALVTAAFSVAGWRLRRRWRKQ